MSQNKKKEKDIAPSINPEERPDLEDYKSKDKPSGTASNTTKTAAGDSAK
jgi:hypothetical protein